MGKKLQTYKLNQVWVVVEYVGNAEDREGVEGVWLVSLTDELPVKQAVREALETFHSKIGIDDLDKYEIRAVRPGTDSVITAAADYEGKNHLRNVVEFFADTLAEAIRRS